eukprot:5129309-Pyramimonas_sp.AAC.1
MGEAERISQDGSTNTRSFAILDRAADRVQSVCGTISRPSSDLCIQQANAPDDSECDRCAHQLSSCPEAR